MGCGILGSPDDGMTFRGVLARVLGQSIFPDPHMPGRVSEEEFKQAINDLGFYIDRSGDREERTPVGVMDRGRLLEFRARVLAAHKRARGIRDDTLPVPAKKARLSTIVDGTAEAEVNLLSPERVADMLERFRQHFGDYLSEETEPTCEQLSAVDQLLRSGSLPRVDFSLFGPRGKRAEWKLSHVAFSFNVASGTWARQELPGPPDVEAWVKCWNVFKTAMLLLGEA
eukprot:5595331-Alexandrium_andersonii.AAC.2